MKKLTTIVGLVLASTALIANKASAGGGKKAVQALQGTWVATDKKSPVRGIKFSGNKFEVSMEKDGKTGVYEGTFKLHTKTNPKGIDMKVRIGPDANYKGKTSLGIYKIEKGKLTWCANAPGSKGRPPEFAQQVGDRQFLLVTLEKKK